MEGPEDPPACRLALVDSLDDEALAADTPANADADDDFLLGAIMPRASAKLVPIELSISSTASVLDFFSIGAPCGLRSLVAAETDGRGDSPSARRLLADEDVDGLSDCIWAGW